MLSRSGILLKTALLKSATRYSVRTFSVTRRAYAKSWDNTTQQNNEKINAHIQVDNLVSKIKAEPILTEKLEKIQNIMIEQNLVSNADGTAKPKIWQIVKILTNKELRTAMEEFKSELTNCGIELGPEQSKALMIVLGLEKEPPK
ncbi:hypothetical protein NCAS_0A05850 [Naumovozyma castellii]|uniref:Uncharacterized protein n=1 Tax=Naumovozyma castellii TaxID=27288 RepID=G0V6P7_NAUCA|nr:hypothetical protein NCAS_0A05850 [Naumovozyma castellii CBS 4309]CCC67143.1 hypothetical protein NCAS_0A05850 [Naumovozyma castellii CBS 4309]